MLEREDGVSVIRSALSRSDIRADVQNYLMEITRRHEQWCSAGHEAEPLDDANYYFWQMLYLHSSNLLATGQDLNLQPWVFQSVALPTGQDQNLQPMCVQSVTLPAKLPGHSMFNTQLLCVYLYMGTINCHCYQQRFIHHIVTQVPGQVKLKEVLLVLGHMIASNWQLLK